MSDETRAHRSRTTLRFVYVGLRPRSGSARTTLAPPSERPDGRWISAILTVRRLLYSNGFLPPFSSAEFCSAYQSLPVPWWSSCRGGRPRRTSITFVLPPCATTYSLRHIHRFLTLLPRFQRCTSLKTSPPCQPDGPEQGAQPTIPSIQRPQASPHMARRPVGTLREHGRRGLGAMPRPLAASHCSALCHCSPAFFDAGATATKSPLSASTTDTSPTTSSTNLPSAARCRAGFPCCAAIHFESRAA